MDRAFTGRVGKNSKNVVLPLRAIKEENPKMERIFFFFSFRGLTNGVLCSTIPFEDGRFPSKMVRKNRKVYKNGEKRECDYSVFGGI